MSGDNFDTLSNKELYTKCTEYGLPNIPVTNSSRGIILKRLRAAFYETAKDVFKVRETTATDKQTNQTKIINTTEQASDISNNPVATATKSTENNGFTFCNLHDKPTNADLNTNNQKDYKGSHEYIITTIGSKGFNELSHDESKVQKVASDRDTIYGSTATKTNEINQAFDLSSNRVSTAKNTNTKDHVFIASKIRRTSKDESKVKQTTADRDILHEPAPNKTNQSNMSNTTVPTSDLSSKPVPTAKENEDYIFTYSTLQHNQTDTGLTTNVHKINKGSNQHTPINTTTAADTTTDCNILHESTVTETNQEKISNNAVQASDLSNNPVLTAKNINTEDHVFTFSILQHNHTDTGLATNNQKVNQGYHEHLITTIGPKGFYGTSNDESKVQEVTTDCDPSYVSTATKTNKIIINNTTKQASDLSSNRMSTAKNNTKDHVFIASKICGTSKDESKLQDTTADRDILRESTPNITNQSKISNTTIHASDLSIKSKSTAKNNTEDYVFTFSTLQTNQAGTGLTTNVHKVDKESNQHITTTANTKSKQFDGTSMNKPKVQDTTDHDILHECTETETKQKKLSNKAEQATDLSNNPVSTAKNTNTKDHVFALSTLQQNHTDTGSAINNQKVNQGSHVHIGILQSINAINTTNVNPIHCENENLHGLIHSEPKLKTINNVYINPVICEDAKSHGFIGTGSKLNTINKAYVHADIGEDMKSHDFKHLKGSVSLTKSAILTTSYHQKASIREQLIENNDIGKDKDAQASRVKRMETLKNKHNSDSTTENFSNDPLEVKPKIEFELQKPTQTYLHGLKHDFGTQEHDINSTTNNISTDSNSTLFEYLSNSKYRSVSSSKIQFDVTTTAKKPQILKLNILRPNMPEATTTNPEYITNAAHPNISIRRRGSTTFNAQHIYPTDYEYVESQSNENYSEMLNDRQRINEYLTRTFSSFLPRIVRSTLRNLETKRTNNTVDDDQARHRFIQTLQRTFFKQSVAFIMGFVLAAFIYVYIM